MSRILIIAYTVYSRDGRVKRHAEALAGRGDQVDVICLAGEPAQRTCGVRVIGIPIPRYRGHSHAGYLRSYVAFFRQAASMALRLNRAARYQVAIVCTMPDLAILSALPLRAAGVKLVLDVHDTMPELYREKFAGWRGAIGAQLLMLEERLSAALAHRVLAVHQAHARRLERAGVPANKIRVILNSADHAIFHFRPRTPPADDRFTIVCHGTVTRRLGLDVAMRALALVHQKLPAVHLKVIGEGDYAARVRALAHDLGLDSAVTFKQPVPIEALPAELDGASAGLVPNRASAATHLMLPVKLLEYAALGIPIICSRLRTVGDYFSADAVTYFEPDDPQSLADAIAALWRSPDRGVAQARLARNTAANLNWRRQREVLFEAIDSLLDRRSLPGSASGPVNALPDGRSPARGDLGAIGESDVAV